MIRRRSFLAGFGALLAAPAVIRTPGLLMPVKPVVRPVLTMTLYDYSERILGPAMEALEAEHAKMFEDAVLYGGYASRIDQNGILRHVPYMMAMVM